MLSILTHQTRLFTKRQSLQTKPQLSKIIREVSNHVNQHQFKETYTTVKSRSRPFHQILEVVSSHKEEIHSLTDKTHTLLAERISPLHILSTPHSLKDMVTVQDQVHGECHLKCHKWACPMDHKCHRWDMDNQCIRCHMDHRWGECHTPHQDQCHMDTEIGR